jgi:hypothetical protein
MTYKLSPSCRSERLAIAWLILPAGAVLVVEAESGSHRTVGTRCEGNDVSFPSFLPDIPNEMPTGIPGTTADLRWSCAGTVAATGDKGIAPSDTMLEILWNVLYDRSKKGKH